MAGVPTFFFSYSRQDSDTLGKYIRKFYDDLHVRVAAAAGHDLSSGELGMIDVRTQHGDDWDARLTGGLCNNRVLLSIISPTYLDRPNCGRELGAFIIRSPGLGIDPGGQLTGVENVLFIRWFDPGFYNTNVEQNGRIPLAFRRINDMLPTPTIVAANPGLAEAVQLYRTNGMELCVDNQPHYLRLLNALALEIVNAKELPPGQPLNWNEAIDAFHYDWASHFNAPPPPPPAARTMKLRPLTSAVVFYLTDRRFAADPVPVPFADRLILEPRSTPEEEATDSELGPLILDVRDAAQSEGFQAVHCARDPAVPITSAAMIARLSALSQRHVLTALVIDPDLVPGPVLPVLREIVDSDAWTGPVLIPMFTGAPQGAEDLLDPARRVVYQLPETREPRKTMLVSILLNLRRQVAAEARAVRHTVAEPMPLLRGSGGPPR